MAEKHLSFKEMCARFDVTPRTLRYYEYIELLSPIREGRTRWYTPREVARLTLILKGRRFGTSLEEMRQWLELYDTKGTDAQVQAFLEIADRNLASMRTQVTELTETIAELEALRDDVMDKQEISAS